MSRFRQCKIKRVRLDIKLNEVHLYIHGTQMIIFPDSLGLAQQSTRLLHIFSNVLVLPLVVILLTSENTSHFELTVQ